MKFYAPHSRSFDFEKEWYAPLRELGLETGHEFVFPHEKSSVAENSKEAMKVFDGIIAEVLFPSTGMGIELGWADMLGKPIILVYRVGAEVSPSVLGLTDRVVRYTDIDELKMGLSQQLL